MLKPLFRVKRYTHGKYKFLVRWKELGKWKRRYFITEGEAIAFAKQQNAKANGMINDGSFPQERAAPDLASAPVLPVHEVPLPAEPTRSARSAATTDFAKLVTPTYLGPRIQRYLGDSWSMHLPFGYDLMRELAPKVFVELGVKQGESYFAFCQSAAENKINVRCYGVDSWRGDIQTGNLDPEMQHEVAEYNWQYSSFSELKTMLFAEALGDFPDATIDLLHIDGTHTYSDVKTDFESWLPKLSPNGIILFHDVMMRDRGFGVWRVWEEIAREDNSFLFEFGFGLGVWKKQPVASSDSFFVRRLLGANKTERRDINEYYANAAAAHALWQRLRRQSGAENEIPRYKTETEGAQHAAQLKNEFEDRTSQILQLEREAAENSRHLLLLQANLEKSSQKTAQLKAEAEEQAKHISQLEREVGEKAEFKAKNEQQSQDLAKLKSQLEVSEDRLARVKNELLEARWETLTLRGKLLRGAESVQAPSSQVLELENRVETATSERDHLRNMLTSLQNDLDQQRIAGHSREEELRATQAELKATLKDLRSAQKQMDRLREGILRKLILPFGRSQRKLQQLTASKRGEG